MDALIRVRVASDDLLAQVDATLAHHGAPEDHDIWALLRRHGLLPGDALATAAQWLPPVLEGRAALLRRQSEAQAQSAATLAREAALSGWEGDAAAAFHTRLGDVRRDLAEMEDASARLADCLDELADWLAGARHALARLLADALLSAEAVTLAIPPPLTAPTARAQAAATIGASVLAGVDRFWHTGLEIWQRHAAQASVAPKPLAQADVRVSGGVRVDT
jgi:uncharacterized protein YukE